MRHRFTFEPNPPQQGILNLKHSGSSLGYARTALVIASLFLAMLFVGTGHVQAQTPQAGNVSTDNSLQDASTLLNKANERVLFMENRGQVLDQHGRARPDVLFVAKSGSLKVALRGNGISYQFEKAHYKEAGKREKKAAPHGPDADVREIEKVESHRLDMYLEGANPAPEVIGEAGSDYTENYFNIAAAPQCITGVKSFTRIRMKEVYPGIDWVIYTQGGQMKYDFIVQPGANPAQIRMRYAGSADLRIERSGALTVKTPLGDISEQAPVSYQDGREIPSRFVLDGSVLSLAFTGYDPSRALIVDPLVWATYYGGTGADQGYATAVDGSGNVYLAGATASSTDIASGGHQNTFLGGDAFLVKFDASGTRLWATYYGGGDNFDEGYSIATDGSGNVFLAGTTGSTTAGIASGGHQNANGGSIDAFLVKFDASGIRQWGTYYGGTGNDYGFSTATDGSGNVYLAGFTGSNTGIASGGHQNTIGGGTDGFLVKFNASGARQWATYYGGTGDDRGRYAATDGSGNVYLTGGTESSNGIASGGHQNTGGGPGDGFLVKFNASGTRQWATYYGGEGASTATDGSGNVYLAGSTGSTTGIASGGHQNTAGGNFDAFLAKFDASGTRLWATYYGGANNDFGTSTATDGSGNVYLAGATLSSSGIASGGHQNTFGGPFGTYDAFLVKFNSSGTRQWATYYGGTLDDQSRSTATDGSGNVYLAGFTQSSDAIGSGGHQNAYGGGSWDAFLAKFCTAPSGLTYSTNPVSYCVGTAITANNPSNVGSVPTSYSVSPALPAGLSLNPSTGEITGTPTAAATAANYTVTASNDCGSTTVAVNITVRQAPSSLAYSSNPASYCIGTAITTNNPSILGTAPFTYSVSPALPSGLLLNPTTGAITGTPTAAAAAANYTVTATNACGSTTVAVNIAVGEVPVLTCPSSAVVANTAPGQCTAAVSYTVTAGGTLAPALTYVFTGATTGSGSGTGSGAAFEKGSTTVTVTAANPCGTPTCAFNVVVTDAEAPSITCAGNVTINTTAGLCTGATTLTAPTVSDNCPISFGNALHFDGANNPTDYVNCGNSPALNLTSSLSVEVWVNRNTTFQSDDCIIGKDNFGATTGYSFWIFSDNKFALRFGNRTFFSANTIPTGTWVHLAATFDAGTGMVNIYKNGVLDRTHTGVAVPLSNTNNLYIGTPQDAVGSGLYTMDGVLDEVRIWNTARTQAQIQGNLYLQLSAQSGLIMLHHFNHGVANGSNAGVSSATDASGNGFTGTLNDFALAGSTSNWVIGQPTAALTPTNNAPATYAQGSNTVTWTVTDAVGNTKSCTVTVTVNDAQKPTITCPANKTQGTDPGECQASVIYTTPTASDNCALAAGQPVWINGGTNHVKGAPNSSGTFQKGVTTVTWKATDETGNTKTCTFKITVNDTEKPAMTCLTDISANNDAGLCSAVVTYTLPTFTDNCSPFGGTSVKISGPASGSAFSVGTTNVVYRATDASSNTKQCTMKVTVTDNEPPSITCPGPIVVTGSGTPCKGVAVYATPTASDNCSGSLTPFLLSGLASGSEYPAGVTTNTWRAIAGNGQSTDCSFTVTVECPEGMSGMMNDESRGMNQGFQVSETWRVSEHVPEQALSIRLYPNPNAGTFTVEMLGKANGNGELEFILYDALGRLVKRDQADFRTGNLIQVFQYSELPAGLYTLAIQNGEQLKFAKVIIQR